MVSEALLTAPPAGAQWRVSDDVEICVSGTGTPDLDMAVCGRALARRDLSDLDRATVLTARGRAYRVSGQPGRALADLDAALALNPLSASAFHERALALEADGRHQRALEDFDRAIALSPRFATALRSRGVAHFYGGNLACARADLTAAVALARHDAEAHAFLGFVHFAGGRSGDAHEAFEQVHALGLPYPYLALWRYLSSGGAGNARAAALLEAHAELLPGEWPEPLLEAYLGRLGPERLMATLNDGSGSTSQRRRLAEAHYYLAALERLNGRRDQAVVHLRRALALAERAMPERVLAEHELTGSHMGGTSSREGDC